MITYFVEGKTDKNFLDYFLNKQLKDQIALHKKDTIKVEYIEGKDKIQILKKPLNKKKIRGNKVFILLDGDNDTKKHEKILEKYKTDKLIDGFFFIEPDLEGFLLSSLNENDDWKKCFETYEKCTKNKLSKKSKFYAYLEYKDKYTKKDFDEGKYWEYFDYTNEKFKSLKDFLTNSLSHSTNI